jgi:hypothetical protein
VLSLGGVHNDSKGQSSGVETEDSKRFNSALFATLDSLEKNKIDYALIGGVAASTHGRPRPTQDIDIFVRPEDAEGILEIFKNAGFETKRFDPSWLFKAYKDDVLIDVIFRSEANIYFDDEMSKHSVVQQYRGRAMRVVSPEDFVIIKCAAHSEEGPHHWHDALAVLSQAKIDWDYLIHRARKAPRRLLALLIYAQAVDMWVPDAHIDKLYFSIFGSKRSVPEAEPKSRNHAHVRSQTGDHYLAAKIREALAESETTATMDVDVLVQDEKVVVRGQTMTEEQSRAVTELIKKTAPGLLVENQLQVAHWEAPSSVEALQ